MPPEVLVQDWEVVSDTGTRPAPRTLHVDSKALHAYLHEARLKMTQATTDILSPRGNAKKITVDEALYLQIVAAGGNLVSQQR